MNDSSVNLIVSELRTLHKKIDRISLAIHGDGDAAKGLVRRVDGLSKELKFARWFFGIVVSSLALAGSEHWFETTKLPQEQLRILEPKK